MKKTYRIKATKTAWMEIIADESLNQDQVYNIAKEKAKTKNMQYKEPVLNITRITVDDTVTEPFNTKINFLPPVDPLLEK